MSAEVDITLTVNGERVSRRIEARRHLVDVLRLDLGLMGAHVGCEHGFCGACTVRVDGAIVRGCLVLAASLDGAEVETIEGVSDSGEIRAKGAGEAGTAGAPAAVMNAINDALRPFGAKVFAQTR